MSKNLDCGTYLQALALFTIADQRNQEVTAFERALAKLLGVEEYSHISDALYDADGGPAEKRLSEALAREGITFTPLAQWDGNPKGESGEAD